MDVVARACNVLEAKMFSSIGIPEIVAGVILGIATVGFWLLGLIRFRGQVDYVVSSVLRSSL